MSVLATKSPYEKQNEEDERLVRPNPRDKPPRRDLRRETTKPEQDLDSDDESDKKDRSNNYKNIGGSLRERVVRRAAKDRIPAKSRETGEVVQISPDTLKEQPGKYEAVDTDEDEGKPKDPEQAEPQEPKSESAPPPPSDKDAYYQKAGDALHALAKTDPKLENKLKDFSNPESQLSGIVKENPDLPASKFFPGVSLPQELKTLGDVKEALSKASKPAAKKPKKEKAEAPKEAIPPAESGEEKTKEKAKSPPKPGEKKAPKKDEEEGKKDEEKPASEPTVAQKAGIPEPKRRPVSSVDREEALSLLVTTFPPHIAADLIAANLHPDDAKTLIRDYNSAKVGVKVKDAGDLASKVSSFFQPNPSKVEPPVKGKNAVGQVVAFDALSPEEQAEATKQHQLRIAAMSLAAQDLVTEKLSDPGVLSRQPRIPKSLASTLASMMLSNVPDDYSSKIAADTFDTTLKSGSLVNIKDRAVAKLLDQVKGNPAAHAAARAYLQANDYSLAKQKFLKGSDEDSISEWSKPEDIVKGLRKASKFFDARNALYGDSSPHPASTAFRVRIQERLRALDPKKAQAVAALMPKLDEDIYHDQVERWKTSHADWEAKKKAHEQAFEAYSKDPKGQKPPGKFSDQEPVEPVKPASHVSKEDGQAMWKAVFEPEKESTESPAEPEEGLEADLTPEDKASIDKATEKALAGVQDKGKTASTFTYPSIPVMGSGNKIGVYHGVDPYALGPAAYPDWLQPHQRDFGDSDFKIILGDANTWLKSALLTVAVDGMVPDAQYRAALDMAIYAGPYNGSVNPVLYNKLLAKLMGAPEPGVGETLWTQHEKTASYKVAKASLVISGPTTDSGKITAALRAATFEFQDETGVRHSDGSLAILGVKGASIQGIALDTVVNVDYPQGAELQVLKAVQAALQPLQLHVEYGRYQQVPPLKEGSQDSSFRSPPSSDSAGGSISMKASTEIRKYAAKVAATDSKLAFEMVAFADKLAEDEKKMPPWLKDKFEGKGDKDDDKKEQSKEAAASKYATLRSTVIRQASAASDRTPWLPLLQTIKDLG